MSGSEEPVIVSNPSIEGGFNLQAINLDGSLITVPFSEIIVLDQSQVKSLLSPNDSTLILTDDQPLEGQQQHNLILDESSSMLIYVPQDTGSDAEARQWYEDSLVATQALNSLTQVLSQILTEEDEETKKLN